MNNSTNPKVNQLRFAEYYDMQNTFDNLYGRSKNGNEFHKLMKIVTSRENILLAYRNIKRNKGSKTAGTNGKTIEDWEKVDQNVYIEYIQKRLEYYIPSKVKRVLIPKADGKKRPLGIPTIEDRLVQQCFKQVLEPICEAKFHNNSYGFRPNRSAENAINALQSRINLGKNYYIISFDIKGFFDNVNHNKLIKQLWAMGIREKTFLSIIKAMLKAEIDGEGVPEKGTPQGGILSPLLANVVLNELDWWISSQWETFKTKNQYAVRYNPSGTMQKGDIYNALRKSKLKELYIVRYADDFKIICKKKKQAKAAYIAVKDWLSERLQLEISEEKSGIVDVRKASTEFLGFKLKCVKNKKKYTLKTHVTDKAKKRIEKELREEIKVMQKYPSVQEAYKYNAMVAGMQNYYSIATQVNIDFSQINYNLLKCLKNRIKPITTKNCYKTDEFKKRYKWKGTIYNVSGVALYPIADISFRKPRGFKRKICNYTEEGRQLIHKSNHLINDDTFHYLMRNPVMNASVELNDNRLSKYSAQKGKCAVTGNPLRIDMNTHHIIPRRFGGSDAYNNIALVNYEIHKLIHAIKPDTINEYLEIAKLDNSGLKKLNEFRQRIGNLMIER